MKLGYEPNVLIGLRVFKGISSNVLSKVLNNEGVPDSYISVYK